MDISSASNVSALSGQAAGDAIGNTILRKAMDMDKQNIATLIGSVQQPSQPSSSNLPSHLGQNINTKA